MGMMGLDHHLVCSAGRDGCRVIKVCLQDAGNGLVLVGAGCGGNTPKRCSTEFGEIKIKFKTVREML
jgi:hypothetical protein